MHLEVSVPEISEAEVFLQGALADDSTQHPRDANESGQQEGQSSGDCIEKAHHMVRYTRFSLQPSDPYLYMIYTRMIALLRADGSVFCQQIERLGMLELLAQLTQMQKIFTDKVTNTDSSLLRCKHFMHFLSDLLAKVRIVNFASFYELLNEQNKKKNCETFWIDVD
jgi:hypothetical protein